MSLQNFQEHLAHRISTWKSEAAEASDISKESPQGWTWTCDHTGRFTRCSPEVEEVLGLSPHSFIGNPLLNFHLTEESARQLKAALMSQSLPLDMFVQYLDAEGSKIPVNLTLMRDPSVGDGLAVRGFAQVIPLEKNPAIPVTGLETTFVESSAPETDIFPEFAYAPEVEPANESADELEFASAFEAGLEPGQDLEAEPEVSAPEFVVAAYSEEDYQRASQVVIDLLEEIRAANDIVRSSPNSRVLFRTSVERVEDQTAPPIASESLLGRTVYQYPIVLVYQIDHRLEWGEKLKPTSAEEKFLKENKFSDGGILARLRQNFIPESILMEDKRWISAMLVIEQDRSDKLILEFGAGQEYVIEHALDRLLDNPAALIPELESAVLKPSRSVTYAVRGQDYFIDPN